MTQIKDQDGDRHANNDNESTVSKHSNGQNMEDSKKEQNLNVETRSRGWSFWSRKSEEIPVNNHLKERNTSNNSTKSVQDNTSQTSTQMGNLNNNNNSNSTNSNSTNSEGIKNDNTNRDNNDDTPISSTTTTDSNENELIETKKRTWTLWGSSKDITTIESSSKNPKPAATTFTSINKLDNMLINEFIPHNPDAILVKKSTTNENMDKTDTNKNEILNDIDDQKPNIVVPNFEILPKQSIWTKVSNILGKNSNPPKYLYRINPNENFLGMSNGETRPTKVLLVGVHGFFPTKVLRTFIGEPTGTSARFIRKAEKVVLNYFNEKNVSVEISKIALEKEGEILERVDFFYEVMKKWSKEINDADFVYFVTHSQGCPVSIILLAKLIDTGIINVENTNILDDVDIGLEFNYKKKVISILGMAGINNGPFYGRDQTLLVRAYQTIAKDAMMELFELQKNDSLQSKKVLQGIRILVNNNVKLTFIGSINDQLVPLYSSLSLFADHPNIFRATFIDKGSYTPNFITQLMNVAGTLINLGFDDHDLIKEISDSLAGQLTGGGHSTIYNESQVYELGIKFALETSDLSKDVPLTYRPYKLYELKVNPYHLPWAMRSLLCETRKRLSDEQINTLYKEYEEWKPQSKQLKDIKYRLSGFKYHL